MNSKFLSLWITPPGGVAIVNHPHNKWFKPNIPLSLLEPLFFTIFIILGSKITISAVSYCSVSLSELVARLVRNFITSKIKGFEFWLNPFPFISYCCISLVSSHFKQLFQFNVVSLFYIYKRILIDETVEIFDQLILFRRTSSTLQIKPSTHTAMHCFR